MATSSGRTWTSGKVSNSTAPPGNLFSEVQKVDLDRAAGYNITLELTKTFPPIEVQPDTAHVKRIKIESRLLTNFWGHPIYLGAVVVLPKDCTEHPDERYPTIYVQGHFSLRAPFGFSDAVAASGGSVGKAFSDQWMSDGFPRMIAVTFQHPTPFYDDSYAVNSTNNGPYGDALLQELFHTWKSISA
jgi:hypothetical protein